MCTIGYPEKAGQTYKAGLMLEVFNNILGVKRLGPGTVLGVTAERVLHNCTTIGGSSGSAIVDITTREAVALDVTAQAPPCCFSAKCMPSLSPLPAWLERTIRRGLSSQPGARWSDMTELLAQLKQGQMRRRRRQALDIESGSPGCTRWDQLISGDQIVVRGRY